MRRLGLAAGLFLLAVGLVLVGLPAPAQAATKPLTVISLTFDDANANQMAAVSTLAQYGVAGTFYVNSGFINAPGYLTQADLTRMKAAGNEIGGHSVGHPDLTTLPADEAKRQVCNDRATLSGWGFPVTSFAYPFASSTPATEAIVAECGYNSARMLGDIRSRFGCNGCSYAETMPPANPFYTQALDQVDTRWTLTDLKNSVTRAETAGGWVQYTFHHVCANRCNELAVSPTVFAQFVAWLVPRATTGNTVIKTVGAVIGGAVKPVVTGPVVTPPTGSNLVTNPGLESTAANGLPMCFMQGGYGTNTAVFATSTAAHGGTKAQRVTVSGYASGDAKLLQAFDLGGCSPPVTAGSTYSLRAWYTSTAVTQFAVYLRTATGGWVYWTSSPWFPATSTYAQAVWTSPPIPSGYSGMSFGLNLFSNGTLTTDDYALYNTTGAPAP